MDFLGAQLNGRAEAYADAMLSTLPGFASLSKEARAVERDRFLKEALATVRGCLTHFNGSGLRLKRNGGVVSPEQADLFLHLIHELTSHDTSLPEFGKAVSKIRSNFPKSEGWLSWWLRPSIASTIFPIKSLMDTELADQIPATSNPVEHQHSLLHRANGIDHDLIPGIKKLHLNIEKIHQHYLAVKGL